jgi:hypothetical protein
MYDENLKKNCKNIHLTLIVLFVIYIQQWENIHPDIFKKVVKIKFRYVKNIASVCT